MLEKYQKNLIKTGETYLRVKARPGASQTAVKEVLVDETIKIDVAAPAVNNRANIALLQFLAKEFGVAKNKVRMLSGAGDRLKLIKIIK
jgi:hypothetical protein